MNKIKSIGMAVLLTAFISVSVFASQGGLVYHQCQIVDEFGRNVTDITSVTIYAPGTTTAQTIYKDPARSLAITQAMTTSSANTTLSNGSFYWYGPDGWDFTVTDGTNTHGNYGHNSLTATMGRIVFPSYLQSISSTTYTDSQTATFGSDGDFVFQGGATADRFTVTPNATDETAAWWFGANTTGMDVFLYAATTGDYAQWDASDESLEFVGASITLDDDSPFYLGSSTDVTVKYDGSNNDLDITSTTALDEIAFGATGDGYDIIWWSTTAGDYALFDYSGDAILLEDVELFLGDGEGLYFGDTLGTGDFKISDETDVLTIDVVSAGVGEIAIGNDADDVPMKWYGETTSDYVYFTGDDLQLEDISLCLADSTQLQFGDPLGTGDIKVYADGTALIIDGVVAETGSVAIGVTDYGIDFYLWAATDADGVLWDASDEALELTGANILVDDGSIRLNDDDKQYYGDSGESFSIEYDEDGTDNLLIVAAAANDAAQFGDGTTATDVIFQSTGDASAQVQFDASGDTANGEWLFGADDHGIDVTFYGASASQKVYWDQSADTWYFGADAEGVDVYFNADTTSDYALWDESDEQLEFVGANATFDSDSQILDAANTGTKMVWATPIMIEFRPTAAETLTYTVPTGYDLIVTDAWGHKIAAAGSGANDDINIQNNDGSAANIYDAEELDSVSDKARFAFDNLDDAQNEVEAGDTLDCVTQEASSCDSIVVVVGYLKTVD